MNGLLWYVSRATGTASLVLLTVVLVLGAVTAGRGTTRASAQAVVVATHRTLALGTTVFLLAHILTAVADSYVNIGLVSTVVPFTAGYQTAWVGLGTIAVDLLLAVVATSLLRHRLSQRTWKAVHVLAFLLWPAAVVHGFAMGTAAQPLLRAVTICCGAAGVGAVAWRLNRTSADRARRGLVAGQEWS
jgi:predicted ferric reductase